MTSAPKEGKKKKQVPFLLTRPGVPQRKVLVLELGPVDRLAASTVPAREVAALAHERGDDPVEARADKALPLRPGGELGKVGGGPRDDILFELEDDAAERGGGVAAAELEVEVGLGVVLSFVWGWRGGGLWRK